MLKSAYVLLWFPKPSETFIFREVVDLRETGADIEVFTLYGKLTDNLSPAMESFKGPVHRLGASALKRMPADTLGGRIVATRLEYYLILSPSVGGDAPEVAGENIWAFFCGFTFARLFVERGRNTFSAPSANGPATAAWVASRLTGIPFSFTGHAVDIHPPDGALQEKIRDAAFVRTNNRRNVRNMLRTVAADAPNKIQLVYNGLTLGGAALPRSACALRSDC